MVLWVQVAKCLLIETQIMLSFIKDSKYYIARVDHFTWAALKVVDYDLAISLFLPLFCPLLFSLFASNKKRVQKRRFKIKVNFLSHIICWYLNHKIQQVLAPNLLYLKSTKLYNIVVASRQSWLCTVNRGRPFISNPLFTFSISVYRTVEKIKDALHIYKTPVKIRRLCIRLVL